MKQRKLISITKGLMGRISDLALTLLNVEVTMGHAEQGNESFLRNMLSRLVNDWEPSIIVEVVDGRAYWGYVALTRKARNLQVTEAWRHLIRRKFVTIEELKKATSMRLTDLVNFDDLTDYQVQHIADYDMPPEYHVWTFCNVDVLAHTEEK